MRYTEALAVCSDLVVFLALQLLQGLVFASWQPERSVQREKVQQVLVYLRRRRGR